MITYEKYAEIRDSKGLTDSKIAEKAGFGRSTFSDWKSGRSTPKYDKMQKIASALGLDYMDFIGPVGRFSLYNPGRPSLPPVDVDVEHVSQQQDRIMKYAQKIAELSETGQQKVMEYVDLVKKAGD